MIGLLACGCQKGPKVNYVEGTIQHEGVPLAGAMVTFTPKVDGSTAMSAAGETDSSGKYRLTLLQGTSKVGSGTTEGEYLVSIVKKTSDPIRMDPPPPAYPNSAKIPIYGYVFPKEYTNPNTSGLAATVKSGKNMKVDFELTGPGDKTITP
ncbi:MAG: hypothetical protein FWH27_07030 [Planctomycetaceae bacterium]|nr:hypothetical protein [Planctomycetaceae bacterium]